MSQTVLEPEIIDKSAGQGRWMVVIFNNETTEVESVIRVLIVATQCSQAEALTEVWEAENYGKASVHFASREECDRVAAIIRSIGVKTEVSLEWKD